MILSRFWLLTSRPLLLALFSLGVTGVVITPSQAQSLAPKDTIAQTLTDSQRQTIIQQAEKYITLISQENYAEARKLLSPDLQKDWSTDKLKSLWQSNFVDLFGRLQKVQGYDVIDIINGDIVKLNAQFEQGKEEILLTFNKQQQLIAANWSTGKSIDQLVEEFVAALQVNDYAKARTYLSPLLKTEFFPERIQKGWERIKSQNGTFRKLLDVEVKPAQVLGAPNVAIITIKFSNGPKEFFLFFDNDRRITNIDFPQN